MGKVGYDVKVQAVTGGCRYVEAGRQADALPYLRPPLQLTARARTLRLLAK